MFSRNIFHFVDFFNQSWIHDFKSLVSTTNAISFVLACIFPAALSIVLLSTFTFYKDLSSFSKYDKPTFVFT